MFGDGAKPVFGLHNTPGSSSRSLGSGSSLSADNGLPDADWSIPSIHTIHTINLPSIRYDLPFVEHTLFLNRSTHLHLPCKQLLHYKASFTTVYMRLPTTIHNLHTPAYHVLLLKLFLGQHTTCSVTTLSYNNSIQS